MAIFTGWYTLGTAITNAGVFTEATTYTRPAVNLSGNAVAGLTQAVSQITGPTGPVGGSLTKGAMFDALTGGNLICYWDWALVTLVPANFLAITVNIVLNTYLQNALALSLTGGAGTSGSDIPRGAQIGTLNGAPLIAGSRLGIQGGSLVILGTNRTLEVGSGFSIQSSGVNQALIDSSGNISMLNATANTLASTGKMTIASGGTGLLITVGGTSVASLSTAGILTLKGTVTASGTPA